VVRVAVAVAVGGRATDTEPLSRSAAAPTPAPMPSNVAIPSATKVVLGRRWGAVVTAAGGGEG